MCLYVYIEGLLLLSRGIVHFIYQKTLSAISINIIQMKIVKTENNTFLVVSFIYFLFFFMIYYWYDLCFSLFFKIFT